MIVVMLTDIPIVVLDLVQSVSLIGIIVIAPHFECCLGWFGRFRSWV